MELPAGARRPGASWEGGFPAPARKRCVRSACVKAAETCYLAVWQIGKGRQMGTGTGVMVFSILIRGKRGRAKFISKLQVRSIKGVNKTNKKIIPVALR